MFSVALYELAYIVHVLWTAAHLARTKPEGGQGQGQGVVQGKAGPKGKPVQGVDLSPPLGGLPAECDGALGLLLTSQRARVSPAVCPGT